MQIQNSSQAKQIITDKANQMHTAYSDGAHQMARTAAKGRKIIEEQSSHATDAAAENLLRDL